MDRSQLSLLIPSFFPSAFKYVLAGFLYIWKIVRTLPDIILLPRIGIRTDVIDGHLLENSKYMSNMLRCRVYLHYPQRRSSFEDLSYSQTQNHTHTHHMLLDKFKASIGRLLASYL